MRKTIKQLEEELKIEREARIKAQTRIDTVCQKIGEVIGNKSRYGGYDPVNLEDIPGNIHALKREVEGMTRKEAELRPQLEYVRENENAKLWYLIRAALQDETLKNEPVNFEDPNRDRRNPFNRPNFNM